MFPEALSEFLKEGVDPNIPDSTGRMPLHELCQCAGESSNHMHLVCFRNMADLLLSAGANANAISLSGKTPSIYIYLF